MFVATLPFSRFAFVEPTLDMKQDTWLRAHVGDVRLVRRVGSSDRAGQPEDRGDLPPRRGRGGAQRRVSGARGALLRGGAAGPGEEAEGQGERREHRRQHRDLGDRRAPQPVVRDAAGVAGRGLRAGDRVTTRSRSRSVLDRERACSRRRRSRCCGRCPAVPFEISRWVYGRRVQKNGHVVFEKNFYSVPYVHIGRAVDLRVTDTTLEVFAGQQRLTSHLLAPVGVVNEYRTHDSDLPDGPQLSAVGRPDGSGNGRRGSGRTPRRS